MEIENYLASKNLSKNTTRTYLYAIREFQRSHDVLTATQDDIMGYLQNKSVNSRFIAIIALRHLFRSMGSNAMEAIELPSPPHRIPKVLTSEEVNALID